MKNTTKKTKYTTATLTNHLYWSTGYLRWSTERIANRFNVTYKVANTAKNAAKTQNKNIGLTW